LFYKFYNLKGTISDEKKFAMNDVICYFAAIASEQVSTKQKLTASVLILETVCLSNFIFS